MSEPFKFKNFDEAPIGTCCLYNLAAAQREMKTKWLRIHRREEAKRVAAKAAKEIELPSPRFKRVRRAPESAYDRAVRLLNREMATAA